MMENPVSVWLAWVLIEESNLYKEPVWKEPDGGIWLQKMQRSNEYFNHEISKIKKNDTRKYSDLGYDDIKMHARIQMNHVPLMLGKGQLLVYPENHEYIISLFAELAKHYHEHDCVEKYRKKAEWFDQAVAEARRRQAEYAHQQEELRLKREAQREKAERNNRIFWNVVIVLFVVLLLGFGITHS